MPSVDPNRMKQLADYLAQIASPLGLIGEGEAWEIEPEAARLVTNSAKRLREIIDDLHLAADGSHAALNRLQQEHKR